MFKTTRVNCMHEHHHNCNHGHNHHHHHGPKNYNAAFIFGISVNSIFVIIEAFYGYLSNSLALMADAGHNLSDVAGLLIAWELSGLPPKAHSLLYFWSSKIFNPIRTFQCRFFNDCCWNYYLGGPSSLMDPEYY